MGWAYLDPIGFDASDIRFRDGSSAGPWTPKWARFKVENNNFELKSKNLLYYGSDITRPDPGTISFTIAGAGAAYSINNFLGGLSDEPNTDETKSY